MKELGSEVSGGGKDSQQTQPKTINPIVRTGRLVSLEQQSGSSVQEIKNVSNLTAKAPMKEQSDLFSNCGPVSVKRSGQDKEADKNVDADHVRTGRLVYDQPLGSFTQREEIDIDFRVSGLPHAVVKQAENFRVRELVKKIENHPHRQALQADLQQNNAYNPFSEKSKVMIRDMGNVELFELCETIPKVQCPECLLYWNQGIVYCICGHLLKESEASQQFHQWRLDAFPIENYVIKKGRPRGARHGKTEAQKEHFIAHNARRRCLKKKFEGVHGRFLKDSTYRDSQLKIGWTEETCIAMDKLAQENHSYGPLLEEFERYRKMVYHFEQTRKKCTNETPIRLPRSTYKYAPSPP